MQNQQSINEWVQIFLKYIDKRTCHPPHIMDTQSQPVGT
jgi:hypothetical protein